MELSIRPWVTTGIALVGASAIAVAPVAPPPDVQLRAAVTPVTSEVALVDSEIPYIFTLPVLRARIGYWLEQWEVFLQGLALSGVGVVETVAGLPDVTITIIQELADLDFQAAFNTFVTAVTDAVVDIGEPLLTSWIWRQQNALEVDVALVEAWPTAIIDVATGWLNAAGEVVNASLQGAGEVAQAILTLNLENIVNAAVEATQGLVAAFGTGAGLVVAGIESAQMALAAAWMAGPPPPFGSEAPAAEVPDAEASFVTLDAGEPGEQGTDGAAGAQDSAEVPGTEEPAPVGDDVAQQAPEDATGATEDAAVDTAETEELEEIETEEIEESGSEETDIEETGSEETGSGETELEVVDDDTAEAADDESSDPQSDDGPAGSASAGSATGHPGKTSGSPTSSADSDDSESDADAA